MNIIENIFQNHLPELDKRIIEEARQNFLSHGYAGTNVDQIAQNLGIGKGTIYRHFKNKAFLFLSVVIYTYQEMIAHFKPIPTIENTEKAFHLYLITLIKLNQTLQPFFALLNPLEFGREFQHDCGANPELRLIIERFQKEKKDGLSFLTQLISKLQQKKIINTPLHPETLSKMIFALVNNYFREEITDQESQDHITQDLLRFIYSALEYQLPHPREENL